VSSFHFGTNPLSKRVAIHEQTSDVIRDCVDPKLVTQAQAWLKVSKSDQPAVGYGVTHVGREQYGAQDFALINGERFMINAIDHGIRSLPRSSGNGRCPDRCTAG
jgi:hypothetical protein